MLASGTGRAIDARSYPTVYFQGAAVGARGLGVGMLTVPPSITAIAPPPIPAMSTMGAHTIGATTLSRSGRGAAWVPAASGAPPPTVLGGSGAVLEAATQRLSAIAARKVMQAAAAERIRAEVARISTSLFQARA